jgi:polar amino acid transport system substrate-binding protein
MKKIIVLLMAVMMTMGLAACGGSADESAAASGGESDSYIDQIKAKGELVVGTSADYPPYEFHTEIDGVDTIVGFDIAIAQAIADDLGVELKIVDMSFDNLLMSLSNGEFDMVIAGLSADEERMKTNDFSDTYLESKNLILVRKEDESKYTTTDSLKGVKTGAQTGTMCYDRIVPFVGEDSMVGLAKVPDLVMELKNGKVDVITLDYMAVLTYAAENDDLVAVDCGLPSDDEGYSIAFQKGNTEMVEYVNGVLAELKESGAIDQYIIEAQELAGTEE